MRLLLDANIFLEVLLEQQQAKVAGELLENTAAHELCVSDFALHAVCLIALRQRAFQVLRQFLEDTVIPGSLNILVIPPEELTEVLDAVQMLGLDFDDAYQFTIAKAHGLAIVTQDHHFERVKSELEVRFV